MLICWCRCAIARWRQERALPRTSFSYLVTFGINLHPHRRKFSIDLHPHRRKFGINPHPHRRKISIDLHLHRRKFGIDLHLHRRKFGIDLHLHHRNHAAHHDHYLKQIYRDGDGENGGKRIKARGHCADDPSPVTDRKAIEKKPRHKEGKSV